MIHSYVEFKKEHRWTYGKGLKEKKGEGNKPQETLNNREQTEGLWKGGGAC